MSKTEPAILPLATRLTILLVFGFLLTKTASAELKPIQLAVDQTVTLPYSDEVRAQVSQRNIILADWSAEGLTIMGIRPGRAIIRVLGVDDNLIDQIVVTVSPTPAAPHQAIEWASKPCENFKLDCQGPILKGEMDDWRSFFQLKHMCLQRRDCLWAVNLKVTAEKELTSHLRKLFQSPYTARINHGFASITTPCRKADSAKHHQVLEQAMKEYHIPWQFQCDQQTDGSPVELSFKVVRISNQDLKRVGITVDNLQNLQVHIQALLDQSNAKVVAQSSLTTLVGRKVEVHDGLEIPFPTRTNDGNTVSWKKSGLVITAVLENIDQDTATIHVEAAMGNPAPSENQHLTQSKLQLTTSLSRHETHLLGTLKTTQDQKQGLSIPFVRNIPIIGPPLINRHNSYGNSSFLLSVSIDGARPPSSKR